LTGLQQWLRGALDQFGEQIRARYGLDDYANMDLGQYPVLDTDFDPVEELRVLLSVPPVSLETLAMRVRDLFWSGITVESSKQCPRCESWAFRVLQASDSGEVVLACDECGYAENERGEPWPAARRAVPATTNVLAGWRARQQGSP
jgi:hypothetical protein